MLWLLAFLMLFLALGGSIGAYYFLSDPSGASIGMEKELSRLPVPDYTLPGLFLLVAMTFTPLFLTFGLLAKADIPLLRSLFRFAPYHWAWTGTVILAVALILWLSVQAFYIGFIAPIQYVTAINGLLILGVSFIRSIRAYYKI
jgi:hypothetical protein